MLPGCGGAARGRARALSSNLFRGLHRESSLQEAGVCSHRGPHSPFSTSQQSELLKRTLLRHCLANAPPWPARLPFIMGPVHSAVVSHACGCRSSPGLVRSGLGDEWPPELVSRRASDRRGDEHGSLLPAITFLRTTGWERSPWPLHRRSEEARLSAWLVPWGSQCVSQDGH